MDLNLASAHTKTAHSSQEFLPSQYETLKSFEEKYAYLKEKVLEVLRFDDQFPLLEISQITEEFLYELQEKYQMLELENLRRMVRFKARTKTDRSFFFDSALISGERAIMGLIEQQIALLQPFLYALAPISQVVAYLAHAFDQNWTVSREVAEVSLERIQENQPDIAKLLRGKIASIDERYQAYAAEQSAINAVKSSTAFLCPETAVPGGDGSFSSLRQILIPEEEFSVDEIPSYCDERLSEEISHLDDFDENLAYLRQKMLDGLRLDHRHSLLEIQKVLRELRKEIKDEHMEFIEKYPRWDLLSPEDRDTILSSSALFEQKRDQINGFLEEIEEIAEIVVYLKEIAEGGGYAYYTCTALDKIDKLGKKNPDAAGIFNDELYVLEMHFMPKFTVQLPTAEEYTELPKVRLTPQDASPEEEKYAHSIFDFLKLSIAEQELGRRLEDMAELEDIIQECNEQLKEFVQKTNRDLRKKGCQLQPQANIIFFSFNGKRYSISINANGEFELTDARPT